MRHDISPGATFPDYPLTDHEGRVRRLSEVQGSEPLLVLLARGADCALERWEHRRLASFHPQLAGTGRVVTITCNAPEEARAFREATGVPWPVLCDPARFVQRDLDVADPTDTERNGMVPHTIVLEPKLRVFRIHSAYVSWGRPTVMELAQDLRDVTRRIRFDWDPSDPAGHEAWRRAEKERFVAYRRTLEQLVPDR